MPRIPRTHGSVKRDPLKYVKYHDATTERLLEECAERERINNEMIENVILWIILWAAFIGVLIFASDLYQTIFSS